MSEVDRLSHSGLYPALPIADRQSSQDDKDPRQRPSQGPGKPAPESGDLHDAATPRPPKSLIDEYA